MHGNSKQPGLFLRQFLLIFNTPSPITLLLYFRSLIFGLAPFDWLHSFTLSSYFWRKYHFRISHFLIYAPFSTKASKAQSKIYIYIYIYIYLTNIYIYLYISNYCIIIYLNIHKIKILFSISVLAAFPSQLWTKTH